MRIIAASVGLALSVSVVPALAQTLDDAIRYSEVGAVGTARSLGTGNSMSALGADWTAVGSNPAGLAAFRRSDLSLTLGGLVPGTSTSQLDGTEGETGNDFSFAVPQVSLVFARQPIGSRWTQVNFGLGVTQTNRFEENIVFGGTSPGSITDVWLNDANGYFVDPDADGNYFRAIDDEGFFLIDPFTVSQLSDYGSRLALSTDAIFPQGGTQESPDFYDSDYEIARVNSSDPFGPGPDLSRRGVVTREGRNASFDFSVAGNYDEKLMVGATLGIVSTSFEETNVYQEIDRDDNVGAFEALEYVQRFDISGTGVGGRIGAIYRVSQTLRIGAAYHTPRFIALDDSYSAELTYEYLDENDAPQNTTASSQSPSLIEYNLVTPSEYRLSAAALLGKRGFVSAELGYVNHAGADIRIKEEYDPEGTFEADLSAAVADVLQSAVQARIGGEVNLTPLQARLGFGYVGAPVQGEDAALDVSAGLGYRKNRFALDLGWRYSIRPDRAYRPYSVTSVLTPNGEGPVFVDDFAQPEVTFTPTLQTFALTVGWKLGD